MSHRDITQGYWWPSIQKEAQEYAKKCDQCQRFAPNIHQLGGVFNPFSSPWPFARWGLDIVGPFPKGAGNKRYLLVGTDYFTKWVEPSPWPTSGMWMQRNLSGRTSLLNLESLMPSSWITAINLIARPSGDTVVTWELQTYIPLRLTPKGMGRPRLLIRS